MNHQALLALLADLYAQLSLAQARIRELELEAKEGRDELQRTEN